MLNTNKSIQELEPAPPQRTRPLKAGPEEKEMNAKKPLPDVDPKVTIQQRLFGVSWC